MRRPILVPFPVLLAATCVPATTSATQPAAPPPVDSDRRPPAASPLTLPPPPSDPSWLPYDDGARPPEPLRHFRGGPRWTSDARPVASRVRL